jgi:hypothetical protein
MIQVRAELQSAPVMARWTMSGTRFRLVPDLRLVAESLTGCVDRDELTPAEEARLNEALDAAVEAVLPQVLDLLDMALTPRVEALPLHTRLTLRRARRRRDYGLD